MDNPFIPELEEQEIFNPEEVYEETNTTEEPDINREDNNPEKPYEFATGNLDSFMHDFNEEKEQMGITQKPTPEEFTEAGKQTLPPKTARTTGKFLANMTDHALATGLSIISGLNAEEHKADEESKKELENIITEYIKESGGEIPIGIQLIIVIVVTYGLQLPGAIKIRKERQKNK